MQALSFCCSLGDSESIPERQLRPEKCQCLMHSKGLHEGQSDRLAEEQEQQNEQPTACALQRQGQRQGPTVAVNRRVSWAAQLVAETERKSCLLAALPLSTARAWLATLVRYDNTTASVTSKSPLASWLPCAMEARHRTS